MEENVQCGLMKHNRLDVRREEGVKDVTGQLNKKWMSGQLRQKCEDWVGEAWEIMISILNMLHLKWLCDVQVEMSSGQFVMCVWNLSSGLS